MHKKCWMLVVLFLVGTAGCRLFQKKESVPEVVQIPVPTIEEPVVTPLPPEVVEEPKQVAIVEPEPIQQAEYPDDPRWVKIRELEQKISVLAQELAEAEQDLAEAQEKYAKSSLARKPQKVRSEIGDAYDTANRALESMNRLVNRGGR